MIPKVLEMGVIGINEISLDNNAMQWQVPKKFRDSGCHEGPRHTMYTVAVFSSLKLGGRCDYKDPSH